MGMHTATISATGLRVALATAVLVLAGGAVGATSSSAEQTSPDAPPEIACGGYAADGELLRPAALSVTHAQLDDGRLAVPATCGGYTDDGEFIGDD